jgi:hypothetical protein
MGLALVFWEQRGVAGRLRGFAGVVWNFEQFPFFLKVGNNIFLAPFYPRN